VEKIRSEQKLIDQARQGNEAAFRALVQKYESLVAATAIGMLGHGADAEDVGQETFIRFWRALERFRGDAAVGTYLTRIAINLSLNALERRKRARGRLGSLDAEEDAMPPDADGRDDAEKRERREWVQAAVAKLKPEHRAVVVLRMIDGYSTRETAALLKLPEGTVLSRLYRGMEKLKTLLGSALEEYGQ
jgi:RNA polymerase sigma-70 factor (ECF subfamily)